ncbi:MAG: hypothetical protein RLY35_886 [Bacteroidota bacterium]|jgi:hypothetical protein
MKARLLLIVIVVLSCVQYLDAQYIMNDPFTRWGIGERSIQDNALSRGLAGVSLVPTDLNIVLLDNPASYAWLKETTFQSSMMVGETKYKGNISASPYRGGQVGEVAFAFKRQGSPYGFAVGLNNYSRVGYNMGQSFTVNDSVGGKELFSGEGGIHQLVFGGARSFAWGADSAHYMGQQLSFGVNGYFMFGAMSFHRKMDFNSTQMYDTRFDQWLEVKTMRYDVSVMHQAPLLGNVKKSGKQHLLMLTTSAIYSPSFDLKANERIYGVSTVPYGGDDITLDTGYVLVSGKGKLKTPDQWKLSGMLTWLNKSGGKYTLGAQYSTQDWSNLSTTFSLNTVNNFTKSERYAGFIEAQPFSVERSNNFWSSIRYRAGYTWGSENIQLDGKAVQLKTWSAGITVPLRASKSNSSLHFSFQNISKEALDLLSVHQNVISIGFQMQPFEKWFLVRKYD